MKLSYTGIQERDAWSSAGVRLPDYNWKDMCAATLAEPAWIHFGGGNIFRGFIARLQQELLNRKLVRQGILAVSAHSPDTIEKIYRPHDNMTLLVTLLPDGTMEKEVVASVAYGLCAGTAGDMGLLRSAFRNPSLQIVSLTITEKGYGLTDLHGGFFSSVEADFQNGPVKCSHTMCILTALLMERFNAGGTPVALVSMDNFSHNGEVLRGSILTVAGEWLKHGHCSQTFVDWLKDEEKVSFPWSMIDKITPRPAKAVEEALTAAGIEDMEPVITGKNTYIAPFVNAEQPEYLVIEDCFPNGRPPLEEAGVYMTDRDTVNRSERMKVTTCLNPLHTALAVYGCLLGYTSIAAEMADPQLKVLVERIGCTEGIPVVVNPKIIDPMDFIREVIDKRFPNPFLPDTPQRIATDTSQKIPIRFGETIKNYIAHPDLSITDLTCIPLAIAGWLRYLLAVDDAGEPMVCSGDPMLETLQEQLHGIALGDPDSVNGKLEGILSNKMIFGTDLIAAGLGGKIEGMVRELIAGPGAVRATLKRYL